MATPKERFAEALEFLKSLQDKGTVGIHTDDLPNRRYREILLKNGFIKEATKGWYIPCDPQEHRGGTTSWYSSYWDFVAKFLSHKYGKLSEFSTFQQDSNSNSDWNSLVLNVAS